MLCVTAKDKLRRLLASGGVPAFSAELAHEQALADGTPDHRRRRPRRIPGIYDWELSPYTIDLALALAERLEARLVYASLTDFVQHAAAPGEPLADDFYRAVDAALGRALDAGFVVGLVADHGMRAKADARRRAQRPLPRRGAGRRRGSPAAGRCVRSPTPTSPTTPRWARWPGSTSTISPSVDRARGALAALPGVEGVLDRAAAAAAFDLPADRIGDLIVLADAHTVLGRSREAHDLSALHGTLRSHGGLHERTVPLIVCAPLADGRAGRARAAQPRPPRPPAQSVTA